MGFWGFGVLFDFWPCALHLITIDLLTNKFFMCFLCPMVFKILAGLPSIVSQIVFLGLFLSRRCQTSKINVKKSDRKSKTFAAAHFKTNKT